MISQFHFTSWPDKDIPEDAQNLIDFVDHVQKEVEKERNLRGPLVVHCRLVKKLFEIDNASN